MDVQTLTSFLDRLAIEKTGKPLTDPQKAILFATCLGLSFYGISEEELSKQTLTPESKEILRELSGYTRGYIDRTVAPELWKLLKELLGRDIKKKTCRSVLEQVLNGHNAAGTATLHSVDGEAHSLTSNPDQSVVPDQTSLQLLCPAHAMFHQHYQTAYEIRISEEDSSDLWYVFISCTRYFNSCKRRLLSLIKKFGSEENFQRQLDEILVWTLLGSAELLVAFRATKASAKGLIKSFLDEFGDMLEVPHDESHEGLVEIDILNEFLRIDLYSNLNENQVPYQLGRRLYRSSFPYGELRSVKAFIKLRFVGEGKISDRIINQLSGHLNAFQDVLESYSVCTNRCYIIIEIHMPCGQFYRLNELSKELEKVISNNLLKETYLAYDLIYPENELSLTRLQE